MIERRFVGRRFIDFHPEAAHPMYPNELERRLAKRRGGDREGAPNGVDALMPGRRRRPPILYSGVLRCRNCRRELSRARNLSGGGRKHFIIEHGFGTPAELRCERDGARADIEWTLQAGAEGENEG